MMKNTGKKRIIITITGVLIVLLLVAFFMLRMAKGSANDTNSMINTATAQKQDVNVKIFGRGVLQPANQYEVKSLVKGEVMEAKFNEGDKVNKGDVLYAISQEELKGQLVDAEISVEKSKNALKALRTQAGNLRLESAISGVITKLEVKKGDNVSEGQVVGEVMSNKDSKLTVYFAKEEVSKIKSGSRADIIVDSTGEIIKGSVISVSSNDEMVNGSILANAVKIALNGNYSSLAGAMASAKVNGIDAIKGGMLEAKETASIIAKASGQVVSVNKAVGDVVGAGSSIGSLKSDSLTRQIEGANLDVKQAKTGLDDAKRKQDSYAVTAPIEGTLVKKNKKVGDIVDPTTDNAGNAGGLALIYDLSSMKLLLNVDELDVLNIQKGQRVIVEASALPGEKFEAVVENVSMQGNSQGGVTTYPVTVRIDKIGKLLPGMNVTGNIEAASAKNVLTVPAACLQRGNKLYVRDSSVDNKAVKNNKEFSMSVIPPGFKEVEVEVGLNDGQNVEIKSGIKEGDEIYKPEIEGTQSEEENNVMMGY